MSNEISVWPKCTAGNCVDIEQDGDLFLVRSTRRVDAEPVPFDGDEIVKFIEEIKAGTWDATYAAAKSAAGRMATA